MGNEEASITTKTIGNYCFHILQCKICFQNATCENHLQHPISKFEQAVVDNIVALLLARAKEREGYALCKIARIIVL